MTPHEHQANDSELTFVEQVASAIERSTLNDVPSQPAIDATILVLQTLHNSPELVQKDLDRTLLN